MNRWKKLISSIFYIPDFYYPEIDRDLSLEFTKFFLPLMKMVVSQTFGLNLKPMGEFEEEKYINKKRENILDDIFNDREINYEKLEDMKKDFTHGAALIGPTGKLFYMDFKYGDDDEKKKKISEIIGSLLSHKSDIQ